MAQPRLLLTLFQSAAVVLVCGGIGASLAKVGGTNNYWVMAGGGALLGLTGVVVGMMFLTPSRRVEVDRLPRFIVVVFRTAIIGGLVAVLGWLVGAFFCASIGYWIAIPGILCGAVAAMVGTAWVFLHAVRDGPPSGESSGPAKTFGGAIDADATK